MKTILPFLFQRNVLANEQIRIQCFERQEQVLQDESIQPLKQNPYYIKSRWAVYYILTRNISLSRMYKTAGLAMVRKKFKHQNWIINFLLFPKEDTGYRSVPKGGVFVVP